MFSKQIFCKIRQRIQQRHKKGVARNGGPKVCSRKGFTLLELAVGMAILSVLSIAVSNMMMAAATTQLNSQTLVQEETLAMSIVDRLRYDLRLAFYDSANPVTISPDRSTLSFTTWNPAAGAYQGVTYQFAGNTLTRTVTGQTAYNFAQGTLPAMRIYTQATANQPNSGFAFIPNAASGAPGLIANRVVLYNLFVADGSGVNTIVDNAFGGKSQFRIDETAFDVLTGTQFE